MEEEKIWNLIAKKLSGEASGEELHDLEMLLHQNPDLHYSMQAILDLWNSNPIQKKEGSEKAFQKHADRMNFHGIHFETDDQGQEKGNHDQAPIVPVKNQESKRKSLFLWSGFCLLLALWVFAYPRFFDHDADKGTEPEKSHSEISTRNGSKTNLVLPDGSQVWLNAGSKLSYDKNFGNNLREVVLTGEAFFDVVHNAEKPFIIHTANMDIKVLGTRFNVRSYPTDKTSEASLVRGSIEVSIHDRPDQKIILKPNEKIVISNEEALTQTSLSNANTRPHSSSPIIEIRSLTHLPQSGIIAETSWVENRLVFQDESFKDLAKEMERWYGVTILFDESQRDTLRFTGSFENETIQQALDALKLTKTAADFRYEIHGNKINITN
jgi:transmembrane sensor